MDLPTALFATGLSAVWMGTVLTRPHLAADPRVAITLNLLSAYLFVLYCCEDPDLTSTKRSVLSRFVPGVSCKRVGATFLVLMAAVYLWLTWSLAAGCQPSTA